MAGAETFIEGANAALARELELYAKETYGLGHRAAFWLSQLISKPASLHFGLQDARSEDKRRQKGPRSIKFSAAAIRACSAFAYGLGLSRM